jgi:outer membrane protein
MKKLLILATLLCTKQLMAQDTTGKWSLRKCVDYAVQNNISVKQADVQARITALQYKQAKMNQLPNASASTSLGVRFGRSIDPTTNAFVNTQLLSQTVSVSGGVEIYNWGRQKNNIAAADYSLKAAMTDVEKTGNDVSLNVANYYLQVLLAREQTRISDYQIKQTQARLSDTRKRVEAGALPELNLVQLESQLATDSATLITAQNNYTLNLLSLKALLNLDAAAYFDIETPPVETIPLENIADLQPDAVFNLALGNQPEQRANEYRIKAAEKNILVNKATMYPAISLGYSLGTNFSNSFDKLSGYSFKGIDTTGAFVNVGTQPYQVLSPNFQAITAKRSFGELWQGYGNQLWNNFGQNVGISVTIPIFNNGSYRNNYERSKLDLKTAELRKEQANQTLKQNIYTAYANALAAMQKYQVGQRAVESAQKVYDFSVKRYDAGMLGTLDVIINQNTLQSARLQQINNQYEYIFRMKVLEFYKGQGLKL